MKALVFYEDACPDQKMMFKDVDSFIKYLKEDRAYDFPSCKDDEMALEALRAGEHWAEAAYSYTWIDIPEW